MAVQMPSDFGVCFKCGNRFNKRVGNFPTCHSELNNGVGYLHICTDCLEKMYNQYFSECGDSKRALRRICRKLDIYWNADIYTQAVGANNKNSLPVKYLRKINSLTHQGKSYETTLREEGRLWDLEGSAFTEDGDDGGGQITITPEIRKFWGNGYSGDMYRELEQRREYWMSRLPEDIEIDIGTEVLIKQICALEIDINRDRADGKSVDKSVNALNTLLGSANLKPVQQKENTDTSDDNVPFGCRIKKYEDEQPIPDPSPEFKDADGIIKYISAWFTGHLSKMVGLKNADTTLYEKEIEKLRVAHPEFEEDDDDMLLSDLFSSDDDDEVGNGSA